MNKNSQLRIFDCFIRGYEILNKQRPEKLTQEQIAAALNWTQPRVSRLLSGGPDQREEAKGKIARLLGVTLEELLQIGRESLTGEKAAPYQKGQLLSAILDATPDLIIVLRTDGSYVDAFGNIDLLFLPKGDLEGKNAFEELPLHVTGPLKNVIARSYEAGATETLTFSLALPGRGETHFETCVKPLNNDLLVLYMRDVSELMEERRAVVRHQVELEEMVSERTSDLMDVNQRLQQEREAQELVKAELKKERSTLNALLELSPIALFVYSDNVILYANEAMGTLFGRPHKDIIGTTIDKYLTTESIAAAFKRACEPWRPGAQEFTGVRPNGEKITFNADSRPVEYYGHEARAVVCVPVDVPPKAPQKRGKKK